MLKIVKTCYWEGLSSNGQLLRGIYVSEHFDIVRAQLKQQGIIPTKLRRKWQFLFTLKMPTQQEIAQFTRQLANLLKAGFSLLQALELLTKQYNARSLMPRLLRHLKSELENGMEMSDALNRYPEYFNSFYRGLIQVSEQCGNLPEQLLKLANYQDQLLAIKQKVYKAFYYPAMLLSICIGVFICLTLFVVPQFEQLFAESNVALPWLTRFLLRSTRWLQTYGVFLLAGIISILLGGFLGRKKLGKFIQPLEKGILKMPWVGTIIQQIALARFCYTLSITLEAGLPMVKALIVTAEAVNYAIYKTAILNAQRDVIDGIPLDQALAKSVYFPSLVIQMVGTAQLTGQLEINLLQLAAYFDDQVSRKISVVTDFLEPALILILGFFIGGLMLALYWPIFELGNVMEIL